MDIFIPVQVLSVYFCTHYIVFYSLFSGCWDVLYGLLFTQHWAWSYFTVELQLAPTGFYILPACTGSKNTISSHTASLSRKLKAFTWSCATLAHHNIQHACCALQLVMVTFSVSGTAHQWTSSSGAAGGWVGHISWKKNKILFLPGNCFTVAWSLVGC